MKTNTRIQLAALLEEMTGRCTYFCAYTGNKLDEKLGYCSDCKAVDCAMPASEYVACML